MNTNTNQWKQQKVQTIVGGNSVCRMRGILDHWVEDGLLNKCYKWISIWKKIKTTPSPTLEARICFQMDQIFKQGLEKEPYMYQKRTFVNSANQ